MVLAVLQVLWAGYGFGVGNQSVQIPFLKHLRDTSLYPRDALISTFADYPSGFFRGLAWLLPSGVPLEPAYFLLHLLTAFAVLVAAWWLAAAVFRRPAAGFVLVLMLAAGHHAGLSESGLYNPGFTHTWAGFPLAIAVLVCLFRGRWLTACALLGLLFDIHALMGASLAAVAGVWSVAEEWRHRGWRRPVLGGAIFLLLATPTLAQMVAGSGGFDTDWVRLLRVRSEHHVFPSTWWRPGSVQIPRFLLLSAFAVLGLTVFPPPRETLRRLAVVVAPLLLLCVAGVVFTEVWPLPLVMRAQLFRGTRFLALLFLAAAAWGLTAWGEALLRAEASPPEAGILRARFWSVVEGVALAAALVVLALPGQGGWAPWLVLTLALLALRRGRLHWAAALWTGLVLVVCTLAWRQTGFPLSAPPGAGLGPAPAALPAAGVAAVLAVCGLYAWLCGRLHPAGWRRALAAVPMLALGAVLAGRAFAAFVPGVTAEPDWLAVQEFARLNTPRDALILVPAAPDGFRIHSERSVTGEWRDGTQQFFSPAFARRWWELMQRVRPGLQADAVGHLLVRGGELDRLSDDAIAALCRDLGVGYFVLPAEVPRDFRRLYANASWAFYRAERLPPPPPPPGVVDAARWLAGETFLREVVLPNIVKYRQNEITLRVFDAAGNPATGAAYEIVQTRNGFGFGSAFSHFVQPAGRSREFNPPVVDPREKERFLELFNFSVIGYSGKWISIEPQEGKPDWAALDQYVEWCQKHDVDVEFHFVTGYMPAWLESRPSAIKQVALLEHTKQLFTRYGDRIRYWQVVNEKILLQQAPEAIRWIRQNYPKAILGIADCARFWSAEIEPKRRENDLLRGLNEVRWLEAQGAKVDFFGFHGHRPFGFWADAPGMYEALDRFAAAGVRVHITEVGIPDAGPVLGDVRRGQWTPELQAEYCRRFYTVCFSHPAVDAVNLWGMGPQTWIQHAGLLDAAFAPKPAFTTLKKLLTEDWRTRRDGRLPLDGTLRFRGFQGRYELRLAAATPGAPPLTAVFEIRPGAPAVLEVRPDPAGAGLTVKELAPPAAAP